MWVKLLEIKLTVDVPHVVEVLPQDELVVVHLVHYSLGLCQLSTSHRTKVLRDRLFLLLRKPIESRLPVLLGTRALELTLVKLLTLHRVDGEASLDFPRLVECLPVFLHLIVPALQISLKS